VLEWCEDHLSERRYPFLDRFQVLRRGVHDHAVVRGVGTVAERPINHPNAMPLGSIYCLLEISFPRDVCVRVETRICHEIVRLDEREGIFRFPQRQYCFKAELRQQRLNVNQVEVSPPLLVQVTAEDGHEVGEKAVDDGVREVTQSDGVLFGKCQWDAQLQTMG